MAAGGRSLRPGVWLAYGRPNAELTAIRAYRFLPPLRSPVNLYAFWKATGLGIELEGFWSSPRLTPVSSAGFSLPDPWPARYHPGRGRDPAGRSILRLGSPPP